MNKSGAEKEAILEIFAAMIKPLMRAAFEYGITANEIAGAVRRTYIASLEARLKDQRRPTTDGRMAVVSGLTRSDVSSLREALRSGSPHSRESVSPERIGNVLTTWSTKMPFCGAYGLTNDLDMVPVPNSPRRSFKELVEMACPGADAEAMLDALIAAKSVEVVDSTVRCVSRAYLSPESSDVTRIRQIGQFTEAVVATFVYNLLRSPTEPKFVERAVVSDALLSDAGRDEFLDLCGLRSQELLAELDSKLTHFDQSADSSSGKRYGLGIYFFEHPSSAPPERRNQEAENGDGPNRVQVAAGPQEIDVLAALPKKS